MTNRGTQSPKEAPRAGRTPVEERNYGDENKDVENESVENEDDWMEREMKKAK